MTDLAVIRSTFLAPKPGDCAYVASLLRDLRRGLAGESVEAGSLDRVEGFLMALGQER